MEQLARDPQGTSELGNGGGGAGGSILFMRNINNKGVIETKYGDRSTSVGYTSGRGGNGVIAWYGYRTGVIPKNCLSHHHWKNTSFIVDGREKTSETFGENQFGLLVVPNQDRTKYKFAYGNLGNNIPRIDADVEFNEWTHIAIVRSGNLETFYIDGCPQNTRSNSVSYDNTNLYIGSQSIKEFNLPLPFKGNLQDFRFSNKVVYEGCFSPPKEFKTKCPECFKCNVYTSNGEDQTLVIPNDVNRIFVQMWGAGGSSGRYQANKDAGGAYVMQRDILM